MAGNITNCITLENSTGVTRCLTCDVPYWGPQCESYGITIPSMNIMYHFYQIFFGAIGFFNAIWICCALYIMIKLGKRPSILTLVFMLCSKLLNGLLFVDPLGFLGIHSAEMVRFGTWIAILFNASADISLCAVWYVFLFIV